MPQQVRDILILPTDPTLGHLPDWETDPPAGWRTGAHIPFGDCYTIGRLPNHEAEAVLDAVDPSGENHKPHRQWSELHTITRHVAPGPADDIPSDSYDVGGEMRLVVALSRLIHDNHYCDEYAARIIEAPARPRVIAPVRHLEGRLAYTLHSGRFWLADRDIPELERLLAFYRGAHAILPERVVRAFWQVERSVQMPFLADAAVHIVSGLEALLKTEQHRATAQFSGRTAML
jgi:hypothetical protein